ncbi:glycerophosphodiester phosphodiesterase family protein [Maricaulis maris]|uniref:Glycerophosphoryl diester phosphodiesterase n=1 Tax=Maricaulis maris TaxID=74318 RepID=A0A495D490_9PROT|nr:glycerophosphodiester phosphodiesterase family protein [Maricaulis maris]RKQ95331.1 glycerophosphoryl diester phosphodiesterase [Maricaulis maris]
MKKRHIALGILGVAGAALYLNNASWLATPQRDVPFYVSHRGVHQTFDPAGVGRDDCTAVLIDPPQHGFIENTLPSMAAAFAAGASRIEIDIHPTTDGEFAVFHDWTLDCRTDGSGVVREQSMMTLRTLDAGYGYTADGGETWPLRGTAVGAIPTLGEVLEAFPEGDFLFNIKSNDASEADRLLAYLDARAVDTDRLIVFAASRPDARLAELRPDLRRMSRARIRACGLSYLAWGWSGHVPEVCHDTVLVLPANYARLAWGWPTRLETRMASVGSEVWVMGDLDRATMNSTGIDTVGQRDALPGRFRGGILTNRIDAIGPIITGNP